MERTYLQMSAPNNVSDVPRRLLRKIFLEVRILSLESKVSWMATAFNMLSTVQNSTNPTGPFSRILEYYLNKCFPTQKLAHLTSMKLSLLVA